MDSDPAISRLFANQRHIRAFVPMGHKHQCGRFNNDCVGIFCHKY